MRKAILAIAVVLVAIPAVAQNVIPPPPAATAPTPVAPGGKLRTGDTISVTDRNGVHTRGRLLRVSNEGLALKVDGQERMIPVSDLRRVEKRDSVANGVIIGALPGALLGARMAGLSCSPRCGEERPQAALIFGAIGAGLGALIDFGHGSVVVYESGVSSSRVRATPILQPGRAGVAFSASF